MKQPNILFIFSDDHAFQAIGAHQSWLQDFVSAQEITPHLDSLARDGAVFERCYCGNSICAPSRATVLTGKHSHKNGVTDLDSDFDASQVQFPALMQAAGYQTAMVGKWHLNNATPVGFDYWDILPGQGHYYQPDFITPDGTRRVEGYATDITTDLALEWLDAGRDKASPFMLMLHHKAPHRTWQPPLHYLHYLDDVTVPEPPNLRDTYANRASPASQHEMGIMDHMLLDYDLKVEPTREAWPVGADDQPEPPWNVTRMTPTQLDAWEAAYGPKNQMFRESELSGDALLQWKYQRYIKDYLRCIKSLDDNVGRVLAYLEREGLAENTLVIYSSDQGFYLGEHGWFDKRWMYEESFRMPFLARWPARCPAGQTVNALAQNIDFAPTFLDVAGADIPDEMQGVSLLPLLEGETPSEWRKHLYYHYYMFPAEHSVARHRGVRTDRYKLIHYYQTGEWELFDLERDGFEMKNLYADAAYASVRDDLKQDLDSLRTSLDDH
ncbi:MAG: sulfatase [Verrucomicrobia bacterium]|jgi:arylsulfatase A-like enzyme|nr:sulfatase [Verrucomicrobiota bacterium]MBT7064912.1 sulfatase [Verrucomicrobiota bacterium]MBT7699961.1 sulfatase [Verrucomicrobiota bacterium]